MNSNSRPFAQKRSTALRAGALLDITSTARLTEILMPSSITPKLWHSIAGDDPFRQEDPRLMSLCWCVFFVIKSESYAREERNEWSRTVWFGCDILDRQVQVKAMAHLDERLQPVLTLMTPDQGCDFVK